MRNISLVHANTFMSSCRQAHTVFMCVPIKVQQKFRRQQPTPKLRRKEKEITKTKFNTPNRHPELPYKTDRLILFISIRSFLRKRPAKQYQIRKIRGRRESVGISSIENSFAFSVYTAGWRENKGSKQGTVKHIRGNAFSFLFFIVRWETTGTHSTAVTIVFHHCLLLPRGHGLARGATSWNVYSNSLSCFCCICFLRVCVEFERKFASVSID